MEIKRLSLCDRLNNLAANEAAHPEYDGAVVQSMARMPITQYLGDDVFYGLQHIMEVWGGWEYQAVAMAITDKTWPPETMGQILNLLAAPIVQIEEAYRQGKTDLLPYRERGRTTQRVESLTSRLEGARALAGPPYNLHRMPLDRFFREVSRLTGSPLFSDICLDRILPQLPENRTLFREAVHEISRWDTPARVEPLYTILVEPFAALSMMKAREYDYTQYY